MPTYASPNKELNFEDKAADQLLITEAMEQAPAVNPMNLDVSDIT